MLTETDYKHGNYHEVLSDSATESDRCEEEKKEKIILRGRLEWRVNFIHIVDNPAVLVATAYITSPTTAVDAKKKN